MRILIACGVPWNGVLKLGSHQIARELVLAGHRVGFISGPISPFHFLQGVDDNLRRRFEVFRKGGAFDHDGLLWHYVPGALLTHTSRPFLKSRWFADNWHKLTFPGLTRRIKSAGFADVDLLYIDHCIHNCWLPTINYKHSLLRLADNNAGFKEFTDAMKQAEHEVIARVDAVLCASMNVVKRTRKVRCEDVHYFPNGVDYKHFQNKGHDCPSDLRDVKRPIAIYVGALDVWFDYALVNRAAEMLPQLSFVIIGPSKHGGSKFKSLANLHYLGPKAYETIPSYLNGADVGIVPFDVGGYPDLVNGINPLKLYEYMACGLPVVATDWETLRDLKSPAILCRDREDFITQLTKLTRKDTDKESYRKYAEMNSWSHRVKQLLTIVNA